MNKPIKLAFSPCPNDTFMFYAMVHGLVDTEGLIFETQLADVEALNKLAFEGQAEVTKLSFHAFGLLADTYVLLDSGAALGRGCGPLIIARAPIFHINPENLHIAIPGLHTTANLLLRIAMPAVINKTPMLFSEIEDAVLGGRVDAGLIIHENRFTFQDKGLQQILDLGAFWENLTGLPIPLGGIVASRKLPANTLAAINRVMQRSVQYALDHPREPLPYVRRHAQELDQEVIYQHINLYVNDFSVNLGSEGRQAIDGLFHQASLSQLFPNKPHSLFLEEI